MCWGCVEDGLLTEETYNKLGAFVEKWPGSEFGPAHIVLDDCNILDGHIQFCLDKIDNYDPDDYLGGYSEEELLATRVFLVELMEIPEDDR
jgi:hypothetical protein